MSTTEKIKSFLFENKNIKQTVAKNTFWLFFGEFISRFSRAIIVIYAARILGAENWGVFSYAITFATLFMVLSDIGLSSILTRESVKYPEKKNQFLSTTLFIKLVLLTLSAVLIIFIAPSFTKIESAKLLLPFVALLFLFDSLREFGFGISRAIEKMEQEAFIRIITNILIVILGFIFLNIYSSPLSLTIAYLLGGIMGFLLIIWMLRTHFSNLIMNFNKSLILPILYSAWPFSIISLIGVIMISTDIVLIGWLKDATQVGLYSAVQRPMQFLYVVPAIIGTSVFPIISRLAGTNNIKLKDLLEKTISFSILIGVPIAIIGFILNQEIIMAIFGKEYSESAMALKILITTVIIVFPSAIINNTFFAYDNQKKILLLLALGAFSNVILNYFLIPIYGINGAAIATVFSMFIAHGLIWIKLKKINNFQIAPHLKKILIASVLMIITIYSLKYIQLNYYYIIILSMIIYIGSLKIFKEPILNELKEIIKKA